jgi:hypothetical protein
MSVSVVYRYFHDHHHDHFYTTNAAEIGTTHVGQAGNHGYKCEGEAFTVFNHHHAGLVPLYRYYLDGRHDHFYTANAQEIGKTHEGEVGHHGYKCEGHIGYVSPVQFPGSVPIHRYFHEGHMDHFYTVSEQEIGTTHVGHSGNHGYKYEGVTGYAYPAQHHVKPVHRYWHAANTDHFYTADPAEIGVTNHGETGKHGYVSEGVAFHVFTHHHHGLVPVYRYYSGASTDHFYTTNAAEIGTTQQGQAGNHGYTCEGVLGYVSPTHFHGGIPVYRYFKPGDHFYTSNAGEIGATQEGQTGNHGYKCEGILGYVPHH